MISSFCFVGGDSSDKAPSKSHSQGVGGDSELIMSISIDFDDCIDPISFIIELELVKLWFEDPMLEHTDVHRYR